MNCLNLNQIKEEFSFEKILLMLVYFLTKLCFISSKFGDTLSLGLLNFVLLANWDVGYFKFLDTILSNPGGGLLRVLSELKLFLWIAVLFLTKGNFKFNANSPKI